MMGLPLAFASPMILGALVLLPAIWWLLRLTPPRPQSELFPPLALLMRLARKQETPANSPWWLTALRLAMAALAILAMAGPVLNPSEAELAGEGPVAIVIDNGWASAQDWELRRASALSLIDEAEAANRTVLLLPTAGADPATPQPAAPDAARARLAGMEPEPLKPDHLQAARQVDAMVREAAPGSTAFLSDGLSREGTDRLAQALGRSAGQKIAVLARPERVVAMTSVRNDPDAMTGKLVGIEGVEPGPFTVLGYDAKGAPVVRETVSFEDGAPSAEFRFEQPVEMRNQIVRLRVEEARNAGAVQLIDDRYRRRLVGLISGEGADTSQPLLSPLYYISKALAPFSDLRETRGGNISASVKELVGQNVSAIVLADVGNLSEETTKLLGDWVDRGGMLIRFAGPRLAAAQADDLLPVRLRQGDRNLGGALSWETPKLVAPFEQGSPFFGLEPPSDVTVKRQVLALQDFDLEQKTWAVLEDGTPLVTAERRSGGWIVLFHVSSDAAWSNLPISGTFVEMLRRVVSQSHSSGVKTNAAEEVRLPPMSLLNGEGELAAPGPQAKPLSLVQGVTPVVSTDNPPGLYGTEDGFVALNLFSGDETLTALDPAILAQGTQIAAYSRDAAFDLAPWMLALAAALLALDCLAVLWISGNLPSARLRRPAAAGLIALALIGVGGHFQPARAQTDAPQAEDGPAIDFSGALATRLAYVRTGDSAVDEISREGLTGLSRFLASRTALEPGEPAGVDLESDELAFYPFLYWPISDSAEIPGPDAMARVDAFMKQGGTIVFDTRDQGSSALGGTANSPEARRLQLILSGLDIPPLEPVPLDHVLTKSFYLLSSFPGRYAGGDLWVEQIGGAESAERPARAGDGVSTIMITSNDLAAAWAIDASGRPIFPTVPADPMQRELSYRVGVNIAMYTLTGNYKADQVHIPALLERLGQ